MARPIRCPAVPSDGLGAPRRDRGRHVGDAATDRGRRLAGDRRIDAAAVLPRVHVPVLAISAGEPEAGLSEHIADLTLGRTVGSGHFVQLEAPDQVNAMIERFLTLLQDREDVA